VDIQLDGVSKLKFTFDTSTLIKIERSNGALKVWRNSVLQFSTGTGFSTGWALIKIAIISRTTVNNLGINSAAVFGVSVTNEANSANKDDPFTTIIQRLAFGKKESDETFDLVPGIKLE
jgi:hypothetical protein